MKKAELQNRIESFREAFRAYRELLLQSRDTMVRVVRNGPEIEEMRSNLNRKYGGLSKYTKKLGNYPMLSDIGGGPYPAYETALSTGILQRRGPCIDAALQDLDYILGRLEDISDDEFDSIFAPRQPETRGPGIITAGGGGGGGGGSGGGRGGDGGAGGQVIMIQAGRDVHTGQVSRDVVADSVRAESVLKRILKLLLDHMAQIIVGLIIAVLATWLGLSQ